MNALTSSQQEEYSAAREGAGWIDCGDRSCLEVTGSDRVDFLHNMISNDVTQLEEDHGRYGTFLTPRGRIIADFYYYKLADRIVMDLASDLLEKTLETFNKFIIMDDASFSDRSVEWSALALLGPASIPPLEQLIGREVPSEVLELKELQWEEGRLRIIRKDELSLPHLQVWCSREVSSAFRRRLLAPKTDSRFREIGRPVEKILRVEAAIPRYGVDMDEKTYPMEARLDRAISLSKGCYVGQEVVAKATHIGGVGRLLSCLTMEGAAVPPAGARVRAGQREVGQVTSAVYSPHRKSAIALAYLKRNFATAGTRCQVEVGASEFRSALVVESF